MTDRLNSLTVVLESDIREDDAQTLISAISCLRGVLNVSGNAADFGEHVARARARRELEQKMFEVLRSDPLCAPLFR